MSLLFMGFVSIISSLVILYSDDYMFGDFNIIRFIRIIVYNNNKINIYLCQRSTYFILLTFRHRASSI